jgi:hypothetical protein
MTMDNEFNDDDELASDTYPHQHETPEQTKARHAARLEIILARQSESLNDPETLKLIQENDRKYFGSISRPQKRPMQYTEQSLMEKLNPQPIVIESKPIQASPRITAERCDVETNIKKTKRTAEDLRIYRREYYLENRKRIMQEHRDYYAKNRERHCEHMKAYRKSKAKAKRASQESAD